MRGRNGRVISDASPLESLLLHHLLRPRACDLKYKRSSHLSEKVCIRVSQLPLTNFHLRAQKLGFPLGDAASDVGVVAVKV